MENCGVEVYEILVRTVFWSAIGLASFFPLLPVRSFGSSVQEKVLGFLWVAAKFLMSRG
jgi:hypothetical protein